MEKYRQAEALPIFFERRKFSFGCFLKTSLKNHAPLPSYSYFVKCLKNGFLCSNIFLLLRLCDVFMFNQICWIVFVFLSVVCLCVYKMFVIHCDIYDVIMTSHDVILWFWLFSRFRPFSDMEFNYLILF